MAFKVGSTEALRRMCGVPSDGHHPKRRPVADLHKAIAEPVDEVRQKAQLADFEKRPSHDLQKRNKLERDWYAVLRSRGFSPEEIGIENVAFKIGDDCRYNPDFNIVIDGRWVFYECKGHMRDDALVKLKATARQFPQIDLILVRRIDGAWIETVIRP
jgi:hypothetical protein